MVCNMRSCGAPRPGTDVSGPIMPGQQAAPINPPLGQGGPGWTCVKCGNHNFDGRMVCNMRSCGAPRDGGFAVPGPSAAPKGLGKGGAKAGAGEAWVCDKCGNSNFV